MNDEYQMKKTFENTCIKDGCIKTIIITDMDFSNPIEIDLNKKDIGNKNHTINFTIKPPKSFQERLKEAEEERKKATLNK
jgi:hypothetical protein